MRRLLTMALLATVGCRRTPTTVFSDAESTDVPTQRREADSAARVAPILDASDTPDAGNRLADMARRIRGDCPPDAGGIQRTQTIELSSWLKAHHARFQPDTHCWTVPPGGTQLENVCRCDEELAILDDILLSCSRPHAHPAYGWRTNTVIYGVDKGVLHAVLDVPSGMSSSNFEMLVPEIKFVPRVRGDVLVFVEPGCEGCAVAMEFFARERGASKARGAYEEVCALRSVAWRWTNRKLVKQMPTSTRTK